MDGSSEDELDVRRAYRFLNIISREGFNLCYGISNVINVADWYLVFKKMYTRYPYACLYYSSQYNNKKALRRIGQDFAFEESLKDDLPVMLKQIFNAQACKDTPGTLLPGMLQIGSQMFWGMNEAIWFEDFYEYLASTFTVEGEQYLHSSDANPLFKVTLIPRGQALGAAWYLPEERKLWTKSQMVDEMCALIGGRVAEEIVNGEPSTGAQNDLEKLTQMAYGMVKYYGMSDNVGALSYYDSTGARGYDLTKPYSEQTAEMIDDEVRKIVKMIHDRTYKILSDHKEGFLQMAALLLEKEVIFAEDVEKILGPKAKPADETETENETETTETENS